MSAEITIHIEGQYPKSVALGPLFSIGRGHSNDLVINDGKVSRNHAVIRRHRDKLYYVYDLGSSNGTFLNGCRISIPPALKSGDQILIANHRLLFLDKGVVRDAEGISSHIEDAQTTQIDLKSGTISILVVDIRNYTFLSENIPPEYLSGMIGGWFRNVQIIIRKNGGEIDKFIGDAVMAYWLKPHDKDNNQYVIGAINSAIQTVELANTFHQRLVADYPDFAFHIGCGISAGKAIFGNVGVDSRRDVTAVGDCVNVAFRIETLCKALNRPILSTPEVVKAAGGMFPFEDLGFHKIKGKSLPQQVYSVIFRGM